MTAWTHLGAELPWLRGQSVHLAVRGAEQLVATAAAAAGFEVTVAATSPPEQPYLGLAGALRLPATAGNNLDALADSLTDLPAQWPGVQRLALLVPGAETLIQADLLSWAELFRLLRQAAEQLWDQEQLVFETVFFGPAGWFGADSPA